MNCPLCRLGGAAVAEMAIEGRIPNDLCPRCSGRARRAQQMVSALDPPGGEVGPLGIEARVRAAAEAAPFARRRARHRWILGAVVVGAASIVLAMKVVSVYDTHEGRRARVEVGSFDDGDRSLGRGLALPTTYVTASSRGATVILADGSKLQASEGARVALPDRAAVRLERGRIDLHVVKQASRRPFVVETPEVVVRVVGTRFVVERADASTNVSVSEGVVEVEDRRSGDTHRLAQGNSTQVGGVLPESPRAVEPLDAGDSSGAMVDADAATLAPSAASPTGAMSTPSVVQPSEIRARLRRKDVAGARALLRSAKAQPSRTSAAELGVCEAELLRAEEQYAEAIEAYLTVARRYPSSAHGDEALFAAAQLAMSTGRRERGRGLAEEYLARHPNGAFANEARRLLRASEPR